MLKNPKEYFALTQRQTFFALNELTAATGENGSEPLTFYHDTFSRMKIVIINENKKAASANIPASELPGIFNRLEIAKMTGLMNIISAAARKPEPKGAGASDVHEDVNKNGPAFTVKITAGKLRGMTPAECLLADAEKNKLLLTNQETWLRQNLQKYPKNQMQIDAINEAIRLFDAGKLKEQEATTDAAVVPTAGRAAIAIFETGARPLIRRKRADGKAFVYDISIAYTYGEKRPVEVHIKNYYAPVIQKDNGLLNVMYKDRDTSSEINNTFRMTDAEWDWFKHMTEAQMRTFEDLHAAKAYKNAIEAECANRAAVFATAN